MSSPVDSANPFTATWKLVRFGLRRDRVKFPAWVLGVTLMSAYFTSALPLLYGTEEEMVRTAGGFLTGPVVALFGGPGYGFDDLTYPRFFVGLYGLYIMIMAALMSILMVSRHTRVEEQTGRAELIRANVVGRRAPLTAALIVTTLANVAVAVLTSFVLIGQGYAAGDSFLFGAGLGAIGLAFAGITAVMVQLSEFSRTASGLAGVALGAAYAIRTAGDAIGEHGSPLSWLSPLAWSQQTRAFVDARWWPLAVSLVFAAAMAILGYVLAARRDFGAGMFKVWSGAGQAADWIDSPFALAFRLHRGSIIGWAAALAVWGLGNGAIVEPIVDGLKTLSTDVLAIFGGEDPAGLIDGYLATMSLYDAAMVAIFAVLAVRTLRSEEAEGHSETVLSTATSRWAWLGSHLGVAAIGSGLLLVVSGLAMGVTAAAAMSRWELVWEVTAGHFVFLPAILLIIGIAGLLYGVAPGWVDATWAVVVYAFYMGFFAKLFDLPQWLMNLSPFEHVPGMPQEELLVVPLLILTLLAGALVSASGATYRRRDLAAN